LKEEKVEYKVEGDIRKLIENLKLEMKEAADRLDYERAAEIRDEILRLEGKVK
jgi:excinuclease ABC subunit B